MKKITLIETPPQPLKIGYARVSTAEQRLDLQTDALKRFGVEVDHLYVEQVSAVKKRPQLDLAIKDLEAGDTFVVWRLDRIARSMNDLLFRIKQIEDAGAVLVSLTEAFDTKTAGGKFLIYVLGAAAAFERDLIRERTMAGMKSRKDRGFEIGRPAKMTAENIAKAEAMLTKPNASVVKVAKKLDVSVASIYAKFKVRKKKGGTYVVKRKKAAPIAVLSDHRAI